MITYKDILYSITSVLGDLGFKIYIDENRSSIKTPSFNVSVRPVSVFNTLNYQEKVVNADVMYFSKKPCIEDFLDMTDQLEKLFNLTLIVKDRTLTISDLDMSVVDDILHCAFTLEYTTTEEKTDDEFEKMKNLELGGF